MDARICKCQQMLKKSAGDQSVDHTESEYSLICGQEIQLSFSVSKYHL